MRRSGNRPLAVTLWLICGCPAEPLRRPGAGIPSSGGSPFAALWRWPFSGSLSAKWPLPCRQRYRRGPAAAALRWRCCGCGTLAAALQWSPCGGAATGGSAAGWGTTTATPLAVVLRRRLPGAVLRLLPCSGWRLHGGPGATFPLTAVLQPLLFGDHPLAISLRLNGATQW